MRLCFKNQSWKYTDNMIMKKRVTFQKRGEAAAIENAMSYFSCSCHFALIHLECLTIFPTLNETVSPSQSCSSPSQEYRNAVTQSRKYFQSQFIDLCTRKQQCRVTNAVIRSYSFALENRTLPVSAEVTGWINPGQPHRASLECISFGCSTVRPHRMYFLSCFNWVVNSHHMDFAKMVSVKYNLLQLKS